MIEMRRAQLKFSDHWVAEEVADLREDWMDHADRILDDDAIVTAVYDGLGKRYSNSRYRPTIRMIALGKARERGI